MKARVRVGEVSGAFGDGEAVPFRAHVSYRCDPKLLFARKPVRYTRDDDLAIAFPDHTHDRQFWFTAPGFQWDREGAVFGEVRLLAPVVPDERPVVVASLFVTHVDPTTNARLPADPHFVEEFTDGECVALARETANEVKRANEGAEALRHYHLTPVMEWLAENAEDDGFRELAFRWLAEWTEFVTHNPY